MQPRNMSIAVPITSASIMQLSSKVFCEIKRGTKPDDALEESRKISLGVCNFDPFSEKLKSFSKLIASVDFKPATEINLVALIPFIETLTYFII
jgi:hypothetical protein